MGMIGNLLRVTKNELDNYLNDSSLLEKNIYREDTENLKLVDIEKAWDGIIFLLTGNGISVSFDEPLAKVLFSGQLIDENQNLGYGPAHYLTPEQVVDLNAQVAKITIADLKQKFDPQRMMEEDIYPEIWDEGEEAFDYLSVYFLSLQKVYSDAAKNGEAIVTFIN
jgi:hypothetical protein